MSSRKMVICKKCNKEKQHFGHGMCSACLRHSKRRSKPSFYLGNCYSELSRRVKTYDIKRPNYFGLPKCSKDEFITKFINDTMFLGLYTHWQHYGYKRGDSPSIDRIDNSRGYTLDNIRFISHRENSGKEDKKPVQILTVDGWLNFDSQRELADSIGVSPASVCKALKLRNSYIKGFLIRRINEG